MATVRSLIPPRNVGYTERWLSVLGGAALVAFGLSARRWRGILVPAGGLLILRGVSGRCSANQMLGRDSRDDEFDSPVASVHRGEGIRVEERIVVNRPADELYRYWRDFENLPDIMHHLESVTATGGQRSHWVARGPAGTRFEWDAEVHNEKENELIAWRSLDGEVNHAGSVHFTPVRGGTEVLVELRYEPPAGPVGAAIARLFGEEPGQQVREDLRRFKQAMESGAAAPAGPGA